METLLTVIGVGNLITVFIIVWKGGERIGVIETNIDWLKKTVDDIANTQSIAKDNKVFGIMENASPIKLLPKGEEVLNKSGIKDYIDTNEDTLHKQCNYNCDISAYEIQQNVFDLFDDIVFDKETDKRLKEKIKFFKNI